MTDAASTDARRRARRAYKRRLRAGVLLLRVEVPDVDFPNVLRALGRLPGGDCASKAEIERATADFLRSLTIAHVKR